MPTVTSRDGTTIAYTRAGSGPPLILVDGAMCHRAFGPAAALAAQLTRRYTVYTYDRRGRGDSGDTLPYALKREIDDLESLIAAAGGSVHLFGISSGAALALEAASAGVNVRRLALYEAPFIVDDSRTPIPNDFLDRLNEMIASDRRADAVRHFMRLVGVPGLMIALMPLMPPWKKLKAVAHTLPYDITIVQDCQRGRPLPEGRWAGLTAPTLVICGGKSPPWMVSGMRALAAALPTAEHRTLPGQTHMVKPKALAPLLIEFFGD